MKFQKVWILALLVYVASMGLFGCQGVQPNSTEPLPTKTSSEPFNIDEGNIGKITIYNGNMSNTAEITSSDDISTFASYLKHAPPLSGEVTGDLFRIVDIQKKDGSALTLEFGGRGTHFENRESRKYYSVHSPGPIAFSEWVEQLEKTSKAP